MLIVSKEQMKKWKDILQKTDDINAIKEVLMEVIEVLNKTFIQY